MPDDVMDVWERAYHEANEKRFALARQVGFLQGSVSEIAKYLAYGNAKVAAEMLRDALKTSEEMDNV